MVQRIINCSIPPKVEGTCDVCGGHDFYQREDDKPETVEKRIDVNEAQTEELAASL